MCCTRRDKDPYELRTNPPGVRTGRVRIPHELAGVRTEFVCAVPAGIRPRANSVRTPRVSVRTSREFLRAAYGLRANAPEFLWSSYGPRTHADEFVRSSYELWPRE